MQFIKNNLYLLLIPVVCLGFALLAVAKTEQEEYIEILVDEGDTLWGLSISYSDKMPPDKWIDEVVRINGLASTTLHKGTTILLPAETKKIVPDTRGTEFAGVGK